MQISIHAPLAGCDRAALRCEGLCFISIHAPLAGCDCNVNCGCSLRSISIHAPLAGCDYKTFTRLLSKLYFNPRTPCGVRRRRSLCPRRAGNFNPRTPCGVRPPTIKPSIVSCHFNPRTPCGVRPAGCVLLNQIVRISIHAPLAGCDPLKHVSDGAKRNFNPRTPCGVRRGTICRRHGGITYFNPRTPCGVRPCHRA